MKRGIVINVDVFNMPTYIHDLVLFNVLLTFIVKTLVTESIVQYI